MASIPLLRPLVFVSAVVLSEAGCAQGRSQSPIDIADPVVGTGALEIETNLLPGALRIAHHEHVADGINNGHTIQPLNGRPVLAEAVSMAPR